MTVREGWPEDQRSITAKFDSWFPECKDEIAEGDTIYYDDMHDAYVCEQCRSF